MPRSDEAAEPGPDEHPEEPDPDAGADGGGRDGEVPALEQVERLLREGRPREDGFGVALDQESTA